MDAVAPTPEMALKAAEKVRWEVLDGGRVLALRVMPNDVVEVADLDDLRDPKEGGLTYQFFLLE